MVTPVRFEVRKAFGDARFAGGISTTRIEIRLSFFTDGTALGEFPGGGGSQLPRGVKGSQIESLEVPRTPWGTGGRQWKQPQQQQ